MEVLTPRNVLDLVPAHANAQAQAITGQDIQ
jgi:hypothetical protein